MADQTESNFIDEFAERQEWLEPLGAKSDALVNSTTEAAGHLGAVAKDALVNSRLLGHKRHPTITDVPFGSWTATFVGDVLELSGVEDAKPATDVSLLVGLGASALAALGGLADLSDTRQASDRKLGMTHGILQGLTMILYGCSWATKRASHRAIGRGFSLAGYGTLLVAAYLANELRERREHSEV